MRFAYSSTNGRETSRVASSCTTGWRHDLLKQIELLAISLETQRELSLVNLFVNFY